MSKRTRFLVMAIFILSLTIPWVSAEETMDALYLPVGTLTISAPRGLVPRRAPVAFPHSRHFDYNCKSCHHTWDGHNPVNNCTTSGCHDLVEPSRDDQGRVKSATEDMRYFKTAYHQNCITCHKALKSKRHALEKTRALITEPLPKTGPTGCVECHPRN